MLESFRIITGRELSDTSGTLSLLLDSGNSSNGKTVSFLGYNFVQFRFKIWRQFVNTSCLRRTLSPLATSLFFAWNFSSARLFLIPFSLHLVNWFPGPCHLYQTMKCLGLVILSGFFVKKKHFRRTYSRFRILRLSVHCQIIGQFFSINRLLHLSNFQ